MKALGITLILLAICIGVASDFYKDIDLKCGIRPLVGIAWVMFLTGMLILIIKNGNSSPTE